MHSQQYWAEMSCLQVTSKYYKFQVRKWMPCQAVCVNTSNQIKPLTVCPFGGQTYHCYKKYTGCSQQYFSLTRSNRSGWWSSFPLVESLTLESVGYRCGACTLLYVPASSSTTNSATVDAGNGSNGSTLSTSEKMCRETAASDVR